MDTRKSGELPNLSVNDPQFGLPMLSRAHILDTRSLHEPARTPFPARRAHATSAGRGHTCGQNCICWRRGGSWKKRARRTLCATVGSGRTRAVGTFGRSPDLPGAGAGPGVCRRTVVGECTGRIVARATVFALV